MIENPDQTNRPFQPQVKICEESLQKIAELEEHLVLEDIKSHMIRRPEYTHLYPVKTMRSC